MTRSNPFSTEITKQRTTPFWIVEISFPTPLRLCNRQLMTVESVAYQHAGLKVDLSLYRLTLVNELAAFTSTFYEQDTAHIRVRIWQGYGTGSVWDLDDLQLRYDGEMGPVVIGVDIEIRLRREKPVESPSLVIGDVISEAHLIPDGAIANTSSGKVKLTSS